LVMALAGWAVYAVLSSGEATKIAALAALLGIGAVVVTFWSPQRTLPKVACLGVFVLLSAGIVYLTRAQESQAARADADSRAARDRVASELRQTREDLRSSREEARTTRERLAELIISTSEKMLGRVPPQDRTLRVVNLDQLAANPYRYSVVATKRDPESMKLSVSLMAILDRAHWQSVTIGYAVAEYGGPMEGVWVFSHAADSPGAKALTRLFAGSGIAAKLVARPNMNAEDKIDINIGRNTRVISHTEMPGMTSIAAAKYLLKN